MKIVGSSNRVNTYILYLTRVGMQISVQFNQKKKRFLSINQSKSVIKYRFTTKQYLKEDKCYLGKDIIRLSKSTTKSDFPALKDMKLTTVTWKFSSNYLIKY